jgi:hypothetical protein
VAVGLSEGPRYTDIQILRAGRTKNSEQRNEKQSQKRTHTEKESIHNQKQPRTKTINTGRKTSHTHNQSRKPKLYTRKRSHGRLAPGFAAGA